MRPWIGLLLAGGGIAAAVTAAVVSKKPQPQIVPGPTTPPQTFTLTAGERYTFTIVSPTPLATDPTLATLALPSPLSPVSVTTQNSTQVSVVADATSAGSVFASSIIAGVGAPVGSTVTMTDNGPTPAASNVPPSSPINIKIPTLAIGATDNGKTKTASVGTVVSVTLPVVGGSLWVWAPPNGSSVSASGNASATTSSSQTDTFAATAAGDTILTATNPAGTLGGTFTIKLAVS